MIMLGITALRCITTAVVSEVFATTDAGNPDHVEKLFSMVQGKSFRAELTIPEED